MVTTKTPKILPWIARNAGISDGRAEALWHEAVCQAALQIGRVGKPDYYHAVMDRLQQLVKREKPAAPAPWATSLRYECARSME